MLGYTGSQATPGWVAHTTGLPPAIVLQKQAKHRCRKALMKVGDEIALQSQVVTPWGCVDGDFGSYNGP